MHQNLIGAFWMVLAMAGFAVEDMLLKAATNDVPVAQTLIMFGLGGACLFALIARAQGHALRQPAMLSRPMLVRAVFEITGRGFYVLGLALVPLSLATAIMQATPLVVVAGAAVFYGETVGWRRWSAIVIGLGGVMLILNPSNEGVTYSAIFAVLGMLGFAGRDLATRAAPKHIKTAALGTYGFGAIVIAGAFFAFWEQQAFVLPSLFLMAIMTLAILVGIASYGALMLAMRTGEVSAVTPFRYTRLLFGLALGAAFFDERLSVNAILGCAIVVASGLFIMWQSARRQTAIE